VYLLLALLLLVPIAAPWLSPYHPDQHLDIIALKSLPPSVEHPFGTDGYSRDVLSRVLHGSRVSLLVALSSVLLARVLGTLYGALTSFAARAISAVMRGALDTALAIPRILLLLTVTAFMERLHLVELVILVGV